MRKNLLLVSSAIQWIKQILWKRWLQSKSLINSSVIITLYLQIEQFNGIYFKFFASNIYSNYLLLSVWVAISFCYCSGLSITNINNSFFYISTMHLFLECTIKFHFESIFSINTISILFVLFTSIILINFFSTNSIKSYMLFNYESSLLFITKSNSISIYSS